MVLQLLSGQELPACNVDCPPGSELVRNEADNHAHSPTLSSSALLREKPFKQNSLSCKNGAYEEIKCIVESVENELHMSTKVALAKYVEILVEEEVRKEVNFSEDDKLNEVTVRICPLFIYLYFNICFLVK